MKKTLSLSLMFCLLLLTGCSSSVFSQSQSTLSDLEITDMKVSVSAAEENENSQVVQYQISFQNTDSKAVNLKWIEPVFQDIVATKATDQNYRVTVDKTISPHSSLVVSGSFNIDTSGLTKTEMADWQYIDQIKISSEQVLPVPSGDHGS